MPDILELVVVLKGGQFLSYQSEIPKIKELVDIIKEKKEWCYISDGELTYFSVYIPDISGWYIRKPQHFLEKASNAMEKIAEDSKKGDEWKDGS